MLYLHFSFIFCNSLLNVISSKSMLKVNSGEKPERRRSVVSFAEETTIIGTSDGSHEAGGDEEPENRDENKTGRFVLCL